MLQPSLFACLWALPARWASDMLLCLENRHATRTAWRASSRSHHSEETAVCSVLQDCLCSTRENHTIFTPFNLALWLLNMDYNYSTVSTTIVSLNHFLKTLHFMVSCFVDRELLIYVKLLRGSKEVLPKTARQLFKVRIFPKEHQISSFAVWHRSAVRDIYMELIERNASLLFHGQS